MNYILKEARFVVVVLHSASVAPDEDVVKKEVLFIKTFCTVQYYRLARGK